MDFVRSYAKTRAERAKNTFSNLARRPGEKLKMLRGRENLLAPTNHPNTIKMKINQARAAKNNAKKVFMNKNAEIQKLKTQLQIAIRRRNQINRFNQRAQRIRQIHSSFYPDTDTRPVNQGTQTNNRPVNQGTQTNNRPVNQGVPENSRRTALINHLKSFHSENNLKTRSIPELVQMKQQVRNQQSNANFLLRHRVPINGMSPTQMKKMRRGIENILFKN
jgi:hypothetical protein